MRHEHYKKDVSNLKFIDVYRTLQLFGVTDQAVGHAVKKLLCAGKRGAKTQEQDIREAVDTLNRWLQMRAEDCNAELDADGWVEWAGGECPVGEDVLVQVRYANGILKSVVPAGCYCWEHTFKGFNIAAYRAVKA